MRIFTESVKWMLMVPVAAAALTGCSTPSKMTPGKMEWVQADSDAPRVGNAYLIRGFIGIFSGGIDALTTKIDQAGVRAHVFQEDQRKILAETVAQTYAKAKGQHEPIVLIGHSLGADDAIHVARALDEVGVEVDMLITIDATRPPKVPKNVRVCYNYYQPSILDGTTILRGIPLETEPGFHGQLHNMNVRKEYSHLLEWDTNHVNIDKNRKVHEDVIEKVYSVCVPRAQWAASRNDGARLASSTTRPSAPAVRMQPVRASLDAGSSQALTSPAAAP